MPSANSVRIRSDRVTYMYRFVNTLLHVDEPGAVARKVAMPLWVQSVRIRRILSRRFCHENGSTVILPLQLMQEEQLSVNGKLYTKLKRLSVPTALFGYPRVNPLTTFIEHIRRYFLKVYESSLMHFI